MKKPLHCLLLLICIVFTQCTFTYTNPLNRIEESGDDAHTQDFLKSVAVYVDSLKVNSMQVDILPQPTLTPAERTRMLGELAQVRCRDMIKDMDEMESEVEEMLSRNMETLSDDQLLEWRNLRNRIDALEFLQEEASTISRYSEKITLTHKEAQDSLIIHYDNFLAVYHRELKRTTGEDPVLDSHLIRGEPKTSNVVPHHPFATNSVFSNDDLSIANFNYEVFAAHTELDLFSGLPDYVRVIHDSLRDLKIAELELSIIESRLKWLPGYAERVVEYATVLCKPGNTEIPSRPTRPQEFRDVLAI